MSYITVPQIANRAPVVSRRGTDNTFAELSFERLPDGRVELIATLVNYCERSGMYTRDELGREIAEVEDAVNVSVDLEWVAVETLDQTGSRGTIERLGFGEAVEVELGDLNYSTSYHIAAE
jgi:hypothetical protein